MPQGGGPPLSPGWAVAVTVVVLLIVSMAIAVLVVLLRHLY